MHFSRSLILEGQGWAMSVNPRRRFLHLAAGAAVLPAVSRIARAQAYPARPVRVIVGFTPGGAPDILAPPNGSMAVGKVGPTIRCRKPTRCRRQHRHRGGRAGIGGRLYAAHGRCFQRGQRTLYDKLNFSFIRDIAPVAGIIIVANVMLVHPSVPAKTVPEFIAYANANPGKITLRRAPLKVRPLCRASYSR
jgi:hypothetical protein